MDYYPFMGFDGTSAVLSLDGTRPAAFPHPLHYAPWEFHDVENGALGTDEGTVTTGTREITLTVPEGGSWQCILCGEFNVCASGPGKKIRGDYSCGLTIGDGVYHADDVFVLFSFGNMLKFPAGMPTHNVNVSVTPTVGIDYGETPTGSGELAHLYYRYTIAFLIYLRSATGGWGKIAFSEV